MESDDSQPVRVYGCRWAWCRLEFTDSTALGNHIVFEHVRRAIPVRRKDIPVLRRAEEGLGDSLKISDIMRDLSSSQNSLSSKDPASSHQQLPSSSLPSPPVSSPSTQDQIFPEHVANLTGLYPTFASLSSPAGSMASLNIPASPDFSTLVRRATKQQDSSSQEFPSTGSQRSVEEHLTQTSDGTGDGDSDDEHTEPDAQLGEDADISQADSSREDMMIPPTSGTPSSSPSVLPESSQYDTHKRGLDWPETIVSPQNSSQHSLSTQKQMANPFFEPMSQPPSQLQLSSPLYHIHRTKSPPSQLQTTQTDTNLRLNPVALPSQTGFAVSTPQRQAWYQSAPRRRVSSRSTSGENTPKPSRKQEPIGAYTPSTGRTTNQSVRESLLAKKSGFRSGTLQVTPSTSPSRQIHSQPQSPPDPHPITPANEATRELFTIQEKYDSWNSQSQFEQQSPPLDTSYPPLQTQAPYQSQSLTQSD